MTTTKDNLNSRQFFHTKSRFDVFHIEAPEPSATGFYYAECNWGIRPGNDKRMTRDAIPEFARVCPRCTKKVAEHDAAR